MFESLYYTKIFISAYSCSAAEPQILATVPGSATVAWTPYSYNYTAIKTVPILPLGIGAPSNIYVYLDDISIVDVTSSTVQLLDNPSFANSSTTPPPDGMYGVQAGAVLMEELL